MKAKGHGWLERTNEKGVPGLFRCPYCGAKDLRITQVDEPCPAQKTEEQTMLDAINGEPSEPSFGPT